MRFRFPKLRFDRRLATLLLPSWLGVLGLVGSKPDQGLAEPEVAAAPADSVVTRSLLFESEKGPLLLGAVTRSDILTQFPQWQTEYEAYVPDPDLIAILATCPQETDILCVLGTWCSDSQREVPRFWKLLDEAANDGLRLRMLATGRRADQEEENRLLGEIGFAPNLRQQYAVELVPTFIFASAGVEVGRIVESPTESLELDTVELLEPGLAKPSQPQFH
jgi:thiol-disulfide isomerase/thioredoxin